MCLYVEPWLNLLPEDSGHGRGLVSGKGLLAHVFPGQDSLNLEPIVCMTEVQILHSEVGFTFLTPQGFPEGQIEPGAPGKLHSPQRFSLLALAFLSLLGFS